MGQSPELCGSPAGSTVNLGHPRRGILTANRLFAVTLIVVILPDQTRVVLPVQVSFKETSLVIGRGNFPRISLCIQNSSMSVYAVADGKVPLSRGGKRNEVAARLLP